MNQTILKYINRGKASRLAKQLAISMSFMSDKHVSGTVGQLPGYMAAATNKQDQWVSWRKHTSYVGEWWTNQKTKSIGRFNTVFSEDMPLDVAVWLGIAWHELGHILYSPFDKRVQITVALNLLEDARIEGLVIKRFPKTRAALLAAMKWMIDVQDSGSTNTPNADHLAFQYAWVAGRLHLSKAVRNGFRNLIPQDQADAIDEVFRKYLRMGNKLSLTKAMSLERELTKLLNLEQQLNNDHICDGMQSNSSQGSIAESIDDVDSVGGDTFRKNGGVRTDALSRRARADLRKEIEEQVVTDEQLQAEVEELERTVGAGGMPGIVGETNTTPPSGHASHYADRVRILAASFNDETAKGIVRRQDSGRLRPMRFEVTDDIDTAYDRWEPGLGQEMFITMLMDVSGSMQGSPVNEVCYALEVGFSDVATVEVAYFNDQFFLPARPNTRNTMNRVSTRGGTSPKEGIAYMHSRMMASAAMNKLFILFTDGGFNDRIDYEVLAAYVEDMQRQGINVRIVGDAEADLYTIKNYAKTLRDHEIVQIKKLEQILDVVSKWTRNVLTTRGVQ